MLDFLIDRILSTFCSSHQHIAISQVSSQLSLQVQDDSSTTLLAGQLAEMVVVMQLTTVSTLVMQPRFLLLPSLVVLKQMRSELEAALLWNEELD